MRAKLENFKVSRKNKLQYLNELGTDLERINPRDPHRDEHEER